MTSLMPELEKSLPLILRQIKNKFVKEKETAEKILQNYKWITLNNEVECACAAVDSSFLAIESRVGYIYALQGLAVLYNIKNNVIRRENVSVFTDIGFIDISIAKESHIVKKSIYKKVLTEYAYTLELENLIKVIKDYNHNLALIDGSFISFAMSKKTKNVDAYIESVRRRCHLDEVENLKIRYLEQLSKLRHVVFLAKSSSAGFYTQGQYSDMYILELARLFKINPYINPGFLEPLIFNVKETLSKIIKGSNIPIDKFTVTYVRFGLGTPVYQISFPYIVGEDDIGYVYMCLKKWSTSGYPIPLEYVHRFSKLPRKNLINAMIHLGIPIVTGRELIEFG
ncbi:MAG: DNA double-strand break repair nuclease NurA [Ignisphaera sp.]|uniref:DNA double-strand break repair nuclease NurA n=1 Tax=Ignisphaera aggregans TaxID=334771 RepID=A0A7C4NMC6_9CREN